MQKRASWWMLFVVVDDVVEDDTGEKRCSVVVLAYLLYLRFYLIEI